nr:FxSxx-COOH system tetratricopeptide repeat protein [Actinophytocola oryzae]
MPEPRHTPQPGPSNAAPTYRLTWHELGDALYLTSVRQRGESITPRTERERDETPPATPPAVSPSTPHEFGPVDEQDSHSVAPPPEGPPLAPELVPSRLVHVPHSPGVSGERSQPAAQSALPGTLDYFRALRPLKRRVPSRRDHDTVLDEEATAEQAAQIGAWWPITRKKEQRCLDLTLVVDCSPSLVLWKSHVRAFIAMAERLGAFRSVQVRLLDVDQNSKPVLRGSNREGVARDPGEVLDPYGRRILLVLTDGVSAAWRKDLYGPVLMRWARTMPVTLVNVLPQWLWSRAGLAVQRAHLSVPAALKPNCYWQYELLDAWLEPDENEDANAVPVPVVELQPRWLGWWSRLVTGVSRRPTSASVLLTSGQPRPSVTEEMTDVTSSATQIVRAFQSVASPPALRLATLLAALPVKNPVLDLLRERFVPEAGLAHVSELLVSGLLRADPNEGSASWDAESITFATGVRELLLRGARRSETAMVVRAAATQLNDRFRVLGHLRDAIADPHSTPDPELTLATMADVELESTVMRALSGPYLSRADRLRHAIQHDTGPSANSVATAPASKLASDDMPDSASDAATTSPVRSAPVKSGQHEDTYEAESAAPMAYPSTASSLRVHERQPDDPPSVWGNVPPRNPNFTGRRELLEQLGKRLTAGGTTAVLPSALHGMGGIGKTQIATEYIYRHLQDYDLIWWIDAARPTQIRSSLTDLAKQLGLPGSSEAHTAVAAVRESLRTGRPYRRWLLVFDAAETPESVRPFFPTNGPGEILITSRNADWAGVARPLELAVFERHESIELLGRRGPTIDNVEADKLAEKLGDLPLAIEQAAAWRAVTGMPVSEYLRLFDESVAEILDTSAPSDYELSVAAAWNVSFDELRTRNPAAHQILHICAFFSPEPISRDLFTGVSRVSISPELDEALRNPITLARAVRDINRYGLAKIDHGNNTIQLHRLVQLVLRSRVMAPAVQAQMLHGAHQLLASLDPNDPESARNWPRYRELLPHAYAAELINCDDSWVRQLVINLMRFLSVSGDHEEAMQLAKRAHEHFTEKLGPADPQTLEVSTRLGFYLWGLGQFTEAAQLNQRTLALRLEVSGENAEETFNLQTNIVIDHRARGDFAAGSELSADIYQRSSRLFGDDDPEALNAAFQHALSLRLSGHYQAAAVLDEDTHRRRVEVLGPDHPKTLSTNTALIVDRREAGQYMKARIEQERLTELYRQRLGVDSPETVTVTFMLAIARRKDGDHNSALPLSTEAFNTFQLIYGSTHPTAMACALAYSIDLRHSGDLAAAKKLGEETFDLYRRIYGEVHPHTLGATVDLAVTLRLQGDVAGARELNERALEKFRSGIGLDHPYTLISTINLASDLSQLGNHDRAVELGADALERGRATLGADHPTVLAAAVNLSFDLRALGRTDEAEQYYEPTLTHYRRVLGESHPGTIAATEGARADCDIDPMLM